MHSSSSTTATRIFARDSRPTACFIERSDEAQLGAGAPPRRSADLRRLSAYSSGTRTRCKRFGPPIWAPKAPASYSQFLWPGMLVWLTVLPAPKSMAPRQVLAAIYLDRRGAA